MSLTPDDHHGSAQVTRIRRTYNQWAANETLEDFALRYTARRARQSSYWRVGNTALGSISFLALEAIGAAITLTYGFDNAIPAILVVGLIVFITGLPIAYHAAKSSVDIDLLTRGAGFGYIGSTVTSLVYATFTFLFFALEAAILSLALERLFGVPLWLGYLINAMIVIPLVTHGFSRIGTFQLWTQPVWVILQILPFAALAVMGTDLSGWTAFEGRLSEAGGGFDIVLFAAAVGVAMALIAQIGEQVDFLRFLPEPKTARDRRAWWVTVVAAGPGWAVIGTLKMLGGSFLAVMLVGQGASLKEAVDPTLMYLVAYETFVSPDVAILLTAVFVLVAQIKINVTNAYAGSLAWSNFFSRLTHTHPGRVVWLVFNVGIALLLMRAGVFGALEEILGLYAHVAAAWIGTLFADLIINRQLGLRPKAIEFRRAHLFDINPVGVGATLLATTVSVVAYLGAFGETVSAFSGFIALGLPMIAAPAIAFGTRGRFYIARAAAPVFSPALKTCAICEHDFDGEDMTTCPFHQGAICSLCCGLETRCKDACRPDGAIGAQADSIARRFLPEWLDALLRSRYGSFAGLTAAFLGIIGLIVLIARHYGVANNAAIAEELDHSLGLVFGLLAFVIGVVAWLMTLSEESRGIAMQESERQTTRLLAEVRAHERTDAELQRALRRADAANLAKSRYVAGISHELRTPLNAILGYAQLLEQDPEIPENAGPAMRVIRRSSEHLADLIEGLLDVSKIEAGKLEINRDETLLRDLLDQLVAIFRMQAAEKRLDFQYVIEGNLPDLVHADEKRLRQILTNLLSNAIRYTDAGTVIFRVRFRNDIATFTVEDTGHGIPAQDHERIFEPFERLGAAGPGTGLGLTITRLLVELQGGELSFESAPGQGSVFTARLMLPRIHFERQVQPHSRIYGYEGPRQRILVVDDNPDHRELLHTVLGPIGFDLALAESGEAALEIVSRGPVDLALIDVALRGMSGWTLVEKLRRDCGLGAPIIMVSAHAEAAGSQAESMTLHDDFLNKPFNLDVLFSRIERFLDLDWLTEPVTASEAAPSRARISPDILNTLDDLLAIGHIRGVERVLRDMAAESSDHAEFLIAAREYAECVDLTGLAQLIQEARHD